jgi:Flp pilus assembly protein protease CpaA
MIENLFLIVVGFIYLIFASVSDLRKREVPNWLSFSLIIFALAYRAFYSAFSRDARFFIFGLVGFGIFYFLAYGLYFGRVFAGGDAKLMMGLGALIPFSSDFTGNLYSMLVFLVLFLALGSFYGLFYSFALTFRSRSFAKEFRKQIVCK